MTGDAAFTDHLRMEMAPFGIAVTALEPGGVETPMTAFRPEEETNLWNSIPPTLRPQDEAAFNYPGKGLQEGFEFESLESYAEKVYKTVIDVRRLAPLYTLGKGVESCLGCIVFCRNGHWNGFSASCCK